MFFNESNMILGGSTLSVEASESGLTGDMAGVYRAISESSEEWFNLREKMMRLEHRAIIKGVTRDGGTLSEEVALQEANALLSEGVSDFFRKIAEWFKKLWAKVKEIWNKFVTMINQYTMNDKDFVKKYKKVISNRNLSGFEVKARKWKTELHKALSMEKLLGDASGYMGRVNSTTTAEALKSFREEVEAEEFSNKARARAIGNDSGSIDAGDFTEETRKKFFDGDPEADVRSMSELNSISQMFELVDSAKKNIGDAEKDQRAVEKLLEEAAKFYEGLSKKLNDADDSKGTMDYETSTKTANNGSRSIELGKRTDAAGNVVGGRVGWSPSKDGSGGQRVNMKDAASVSAIACRKLSTVATTAFGMLIGAIRERRSEFRSILARMATYSPKSEGYDFSNESGSILDQF